MISRAWLPGRRPAQESLPALFARRKDAFVSALESAPLEGVTKADLRERSGMGRTWVHLHLRALTERAAVRETAGRYAPQPGADIREALAAIRDESAALNAGLATRLRGQEPSS